jgi:hypothetical protein
MGKMGIILGNCGERSRRRGKERVEAHGAKESFQVSFMEGPLNDQIGTPNGRSAAELNSAHLHPNPRGSSASNAPLTTSLMDNRFVVAYSRTL